MFVSLYYLHYLQKLKYAKMNFLFHIKKNIIHRNVKQRCSFNFNRLFLIPQASVFLTYLADSDDATSLFIQTQMVTFLC